MSEKALEEIETELGIQLDEETLESNSLIVFSVDEESQIEQMKALHDWLEDKKEENDWDAEFLIVDRINDVHMITGGDLIDE